MTASRVLTALVLIPIVVGIVWYGTPAIVAALSALVLLPALYEFFRLGAQAGLPGYWRWTTVCGLLLLYAQWGAGQVETHPLGYGLDIVRSVGAVNLPVEGVILIFAAGIAAIGLATRRPIAEIFPSAAVSAAGLLFVALPFSYLVRLDATERVGKQLVLFALAIVWAGDTLAYFVGRSFGRVPMAPSLSPKKTWEGAAANLLAGLFVAVAFARWMGTDLSVMLIVAVLANVAGQVGDLFESAYKRSAGVKDSGVLLPGHGGMLDRIDSLIFAAPVVWCYVGWWSWRGHG
jgi:phosphatidate cytidylyltransferase